MARVLFPSVVVGIGKFGSQVLEDLATQLSHAYGPSAREGIALLTVGLAGQGVAPSLPYYSLYEDPSDWLDTPRTIARVLGYTPAHTWDLRDYRGVQLNSSQLYKAQNRQLARLAFLKHLSHRRTQMETFFQHQARKLLMGTKQSTGHVYLLAALDELEGNALLLDLAAALHGAFYPMLQPMRIIAYLAMPTAFSAVETFSPQVLANAFGFLRELEQAQLSHYVPNPYCKQQVLPHPLINFVRLYDSPPKKHAARPFLRAQWADALLPLLDDFFGLQFTQDHWANLPNQEQEARGQDKTLVFVGTQHVANVVFPRETLHRYWQTHLARTALALHTRHDLDKDIWIETLNRWVQNALPLQDTQAHPIHTPRVLTHIIASSSSTARGSKAQWKAWLCAEDEVESGRDVQKKASRYRAQLEWRPSENTIATLRAPNPLPHHLKSAVDKRLAQLFSPLKPETCDITGGQVREALADVAALQTQKSYASLIALARYQIRTLGIVPTFYAFQHIAQKLSAFQSAIQVSRNDLHHKLESNLRRMHHAATNIVDVKRRTLLGNKLSHHAQTYLDAVVDVVEVASEYVALELVAQLAHSLTLLAEQIGEQLGSWQHALWQPESSLALFQRLEAREKRLYQALNNPAQNGRYQLLSTEWVAAQTERLCNKHAKPLAQKLQWHFVQNDEGTRPTLEIELYLDEVPLHKLTHETYHSLNESRLLQAADTLLSDELKSMTLWDFILPNKDAVLPEIANALSQVYTPLDSNAEETGGAAHYFLTPESSARAAQQPLLNKWQQEVEQNLNVLLHPVQIGSEAHLMLWANTDIVPLRQTQGYRATQQSYYDLSPRERVRVFAFAREATASWLENELQRLQWLAPNTQLHPQAVGLLGQWSCLQRFVWVDALKWLRTYPRQDMNQYAVVIPAAHGDGEEVYPIGEPSVTLTLCQAVQGFCDVFSTENKQSDSRMALAKMDLDELVETYIRHEAQAHMRKTHSKKREPYWVWAYALQKQKRDWPWALYQALRAQHMDRYYQLQFGQAQEQQPGTFQHDLRLTLAYIAHAYAEMYKNAIRQKAR